MINGAMVPKKGASSTIASMMIDIDGDGQIDAEEFKLFRKIQHAVPDDVDGDGLFSADEIYLAKQQLGKKIIAEDFVQKHKNQLVKFGWLATASKEDVVGKIQHARDFGGLLGHLRTVERKMRLQGSSQMQKGLRNPYTNRPQTGRNKTFSVGKPLETRALCAGIGPCIKNSCSFDSSLAKHVIR
jgi:hypothetical protein